MLFGSLKTKIFLLVIIIAILGGGSAMVFTRTEVETAMLAAEERSNQNILDLAQLTIETRYQSLLYEKLATIRQSKAQMQRLGGMVKATMQQYEALVEASVLTQAQAQELFKQWVSRLTLNQGEYVLAFDNDFRAVIYPEADLIGQKLTEYRDLKGRVVVETAQAELRRVSEAFSIYRWRKIGSPELVTKFGYFMSFPQWGWVVGVAANVADVEEAMRVKLQETIKVLRQKLTRIRVADTGYVFIFDGKKQVLVQPDGVDLAAARDRQTGAPLLDELMAAAQDREVGSLLFQQAGPGGQDVAMQSHVTYFKALDWYVATMASVDEVAKPARVLMTSQMLLLSLVVVLSILLGYALSVRITKPLQRLSDYAKKLPEKDLTAPQAGEPEMRGLADKYHDEVGRLADSFIFMEESLRRNIAQLMEVTISKQRIENELNIARDIQLGLLNKIFPPFPERSEFDLYASLDSAREVGGDLYDYFFLDENRLCFAVGDVSGKGVPASLFMAVTKTLIQAKVTKNSEPGQLMEAINESLCRDNPNCMFVTLFIGVLDVRDGHVSYANGGHNPPMVMRAATGEVEILPKRNGPTVGVFEGISYQTKHLDLHPGDQILIYTDGVTEALNRQDEIYGEARLLECVQQTEWSDAGRMIRSVLTDVTRFMDGAEKSDDITMLCINYH